MITYRLFIMIFILFYILTGCKKNNNQSKDNIINREKIYGTWTTFISNGNLNGKEFISFSPPDIFHITDSIIFNDEDSGFEFKLPLSLNIVGKWNLKKDSLFIECNSETININTYTDKLEITSSKDSVRLEMLESLKGEMGEKLVSTVLSILSEQYEEMSGKELYLGKIIYHCQDTLYLNKNNILVCLQKTNQ